MSRGRHSSVAGLHILAASVCGALASRSWGVAVLFVLMGILWALRDAAVLRAIGARSSLVLAGIIVLSAYLASPGSHLPTLVMLARAAVILWAVTGVAASASMEDFACLGSRFGLRGLGFALGTAANALPRTLAEMREIWWTYQMRRGRWPGPAQWRRLALAALASTATRADEIAVAAEARGLDPLSYDPPRRAVTRADRAWCVAAWAIAALAVTIDVLSRQ